MKKIYLIGLLVFILPFKVLPQNINGRISSSVYTFERYEAENVSNTYYRAYQMLNLNINKDKFSLRTYLNLEDDFSKKIKYDPRLRFYNLYFEGRNLFELATIKIGRIPIYSSMLGGVYDGGELKLRYDDYRLNVFYGLNTPPYQKLEIIKNSKDNYILGGDFSLSFLNDFNFTVGYVKKHFQTEAYNSLRFDDDLNPINVLIRSKSLQYEYASAKINYEIEDKLDTYLRYEFDFNFEKTSKVELFSTYNYSDKINFDVYYNYREPRVRYNSIFSVFDYGNTQEIEIGTGYKLAPGFIGNVRLGAVNYSVGNTSGRVNIGVQTPYGGVNYRNSFGVEGELQSISLNSGYSLLNGLITPTVGFSYTKYKSSRDYGELNNLILLLAGINYRPYRVLSADIQGQFMNNKIYKNDFRLLFRLNYSFNTNLSIF